MSGSTMFPDRDGPFVAWLAGRTPQARGLKLDHARQLTLGHSNQTWDVAVSWEGGSDRYVLRAPPIGVGLLEPYDVARQYHVMKALEGSPVPLPRMLWLEESGEVLGKPFFLMERLDGFAVERGLPEELDRSPAAIRAICEQYIDAVAAVHMADWRAIDTRLPAPPADPVAFEIDWWAGKITEHCDDRLPSFEAVIAWLRANKPAPASPRLVHGDPKLGNLLLKGDRLVGLLDWEMASIGDPLCDLGWFSYLWNSFFTAGFVDLPGAMSWDEMAARYTEKTGIAVENIEYYQVLQGFKTIAICFVGYMMFQRGITDDVRFQHFGYVVPPELDRMLALAGLEPAPHGAVLEPLVGVL